MKEELHKIIEKVKKKGMREGLRHVCGHIYSDTEYFVFRHDMKEIPDLTSDFGNFHIKDMYNPDYKILEEVHHRWPLETIPGYVKYIKNYLSEFGKNDSVCFVLLYNDKLAGVNWISRPNYYYSKLNIPYLHNEYVSHWTFIMPGYRGMGASKFLKSHSLKIAKQKEIPSVLSLVSVKNIPSIRMNRGVGFKIIGTLTEKYRFFRYSQCFKEIDDTAGLNL